MHGSERDLGNQSTHMVRENPVSWYSGPCLIVETAQEQRFTANQRRQALCPWTQQDILLQCLPASFQSQSDTKHFVSAVGPNRRQKEGALQPGGSFFFVSAFHPPCSTPPGMSVAGETGMNRLWCSCRTTTASANAATMEKKEPKRPTKQKESWRKNLR